MAVAIVGVVPYAAREKWAKSDLGTASPAHQKYKYFKLGMGGWEDVGGGVIQPRTPDPALTDLDCIVNPGRYPGGAEMRFVWNSFTDNEAPHPQRFEGTDLWYESPRTAVARCMIYFNEGNDRGDGQPPEFFELGVFDENDVMVVYATFPKETKTEDVELEKEVRVTR